MIYIKSLIIRRLVIRTDILEVCLAIPAAKIKLIEK